MRRQAEGETDEVERAFGQLVVAAELCLDEGDACLIALLVVLLSSGRGGGESFERGVVENRAVLYLFPRRVGAEAVEEAV